MGNDRLAPHVIAARQLWRGDNRFETDRIDALPNGGGPVNAAIVPPTYNCPGLLDDHHVPPVVVSRAHFCRSGCCISRPIADFCRRFPPHSVGHGSQYPGWRVILSSSIIAGDASNRPFNASHAADEATPCARFEFFFTGTTRRSSLLLNDLRRLKRRDGRQFAFEALDINQRRMRRRPL